MARAGQAEVRPADDSQQIEVRITGKLSEQAEHVGVERLHRIARHPRGGMRFEAHRQVDHSVEAVQIPRSPQVQLQRRLDTLFLAVQRPAQLTAVDIRHERADASGCTRLPANEFLVNRRQLDRRSRRKTIDDPVNVVGAEVVAPRRRQRHRAGAVVWDNTSREARH